MRFDIVTGENKDEIIHADLPVGQSEAERLARNISDQYGDPNVTAVEV